MPTTVALRRTAGRARSAALERLTRARRATFALTHVERSGIPEHRFAAALQHVTHVGSTVRTELVEVPLQDLLLGGEPGISARRLAAATADPLRPSTRAVDGALAQLLQQYRGEGDAVLAPERLRRSAIYNEAVTSLRLTGEYHGARRDDELIPLLGDMARGTTEGTEPIVVARVKHSSCFQLQGSGPSVAAVLGRGEPTVLARVLPGSVSTPVQDLLVRMSWLGGERQLYQPIDAPELASWGLVRQCSDRLELMRAFLDSHHLDSGSYLDVASCYGWFVDQMLAAGFDAYGVERDELAVQCGEWVYGLPPDRVLTGNTDSFFRSRRRRYDVVSCFSLLHHAVRSEERTAIRLIRDLDAATGRVLFLDTGEEHEAWLRHLLPGWDAAFIADWLRRHTTFSSVVPLGTDRDRRPPNGDNYGRTLFACIR